MKALPLIILLAVVSSACPQASASQSAVSALENQHQIPLLNNRFRIDHEIDQVTLLFYRKAGSPSAVLVRPDGSKLYAVDAYNRDNMQWFDEPRYDLIVLDNPMPGPWQVIGEIQPDSTVAVLGDITLEVEPLPSLLFQGEVLSLHARVLNDGEPIQSGYFRDVVKIDVTFASTQNENFENFASDPVPMTRFEDNGRGYDKRPGDAVFTGEFNLDIAPGQWQSEITLDTPILKRKVTLDPVIVVEPPLSIDFVEGEGKQPHEARVEIDSSMVRSESLIMKGTIFYPNNEQQAFALPAQNGAERILTLNNYQQGRYSIQVSLFGTTVKGREFVANIPTYNFLVKEPVLVPKPASLAIEPLVIESEPQQQEKSVPSWLFYTLILVTNLILLLIGTILIRRYILNKSRLPGSKLLSKNKKQASSGAEQESRKNEKVGAKRSKSDKSGEILNLSLGDD